MSDFAALIADSPLPWVLKIKLPYPNALCQDPIGWTIEDANGVRVANDTCNDTEWGLDESELLFAKAVVELANRK